MRSVWSANNTRQPRPALTGDLRTEVLVIGGGMAGVLAAWRLTEAGVPCVLVEAASVGSGITKNTTAKICAQHGLIYSDLIKRFGREKAGEYYDSNTRAIEDFRTLAQRFPCDLEDKTAYVYSITDRNKLELEAKAYLKLSIPPRIVDNPPLPINTVGALAMEKMAQFNPLKLLFPLSDSLEIYENTFVNALDGMTAITDMGKIHAKHIIIATHFPMVNVPGLYFIKLYQHRSYVMALEGAPLLDGMFIDEQETGCSFRTYQDLLLIGGGDHKTGKIGGGFDELRSLAGRAYPKAAERYRWATQDCMSLDGIPYIGRHRGGTPGLYVATGFNKWGMTGSMVASRLLCDLITKGKSELESLYSPQRSMLTGQFFVNLGAAAAGLLNLGGPRCAHMGCKLHWNKSENSWDCTCHGSRFEKSGHIIDNPAKRGITR